jgi:hypothetical protein
MVRVGEGIRLVARYKLSEQLIVRVIAGWPRGDTVRRLN